MHSNNFFTSVYQVKIPKIIYGTAWKKERTAELVAQAINIGFRGIDTACQPKHYHEAGVGAGVSLAYAKYGLQRSDLYLQTKFTPVNGHDPLQIPYDKHASLTIQVEQSFQKSLENLQTDYLDCLVLHSPLSNQLQLSEVWQTMEGLVAKGGVKQLGISNCYNLQQFQDLHQVATVKPAVIQNRFYAESDYDKQIRAFCREQNIIYQSFWTLTANPHILAHRFLKSLSEKYRRSSAQIFFRYLSQIGIAPLTGTCSAEHMQDDLAIFAFELFPEECAEISKLLAL